MALPCIEIRNGALKFSAEWVLREVNVRIMPGERIAVIGPSGKGKSSLLKMLAGLLPPSEGTLLIEGRDFHQAPVAERQALRLKMGMLFQKNALFDSLNNSENIAFALRETGKRTPAEIQAIVLRFLEAVGIGHAKDLFPDEISGGMQKRLGIARALALDPEIVFYDDPTAGLDPITSRKIIDLIVDLQTKKNATVVAVTNDINRAYQLAHRIFIVMDGQVMETGTPAQTRAHGDPRVQQFIKGEAQGPLTRHA